METIEKILLEALLEPSRTLLFTILHIVLHTRGKQKNIFESILGTTFY